MLGAEILSEATRGMQPGAASVYFFTRVISTPIQSLSQIIAFCPLPCVTIAGGVVAPCAIVAISARCAAVHVGFA